MEKEREKGPDTAAHGGTPLGERFAGILDEVGLGGTRKKTLSENPYS